MGCGGGGGRGGGVGREGLGVSMCPAFWFVSLMSA